MIKLIDRYFIKEFIPPFLFSLGALTGILLMDQLFRLIDLFVRKGLPAQVVGQVLIYTLPLIVSYTAPMAILVAVVMSFGRLAQDNEILALKTSGLTFFRIMRTPLILTVIFMIALMFFNNIILPESNHRVRNLMLDVAKKRPAIRLPEGVFTNEFTGYTVYIGRKDERRSRLYDITIYDQRNDVMMTAPTGELKDYEDQGILQFILYNGELHQLLDNKNYQKTQFAKQTINMNVNTALIRQERRFRNQNELDISGLERRIDDTKKEIEELKRDIENTAVDAINRFVRGDERILGITRFQIEKQIQLLKGKERTLSRYLVEFNKKFSLAFVCIVFILIGAPLGYLFKRGGIAGVLVGILLFSLYYILVLAGEEFADRRGFSPFWAMWLPNILLLGCGIYLFFVAEYEKSPLTRLFK